MELRCVRPRIEDARHAVPGQPQWCSQISLMVPNCDRLTTKRTCPQPSVAAPSTGPGGGRGARDANEPQQALRGDPQSQSTWHPHAPRFPLCGPAHLTPAGLPGPSALYQTLRHQVLSRLLQARGALRVESVIMARPQKVEHKDASGPIGTRLSLSLSGRERAPRSPHGRHGCGPYAQKLCNVHISGGQEDDDDLPEVNAEGGGMVETTVQHQPNVLNEQASQSSAVMGAGV